MRIRLINCSTDDIKHTLDNIIESYDIQINTANLYINFIKNGRSIDLYDFNSLEPVYLNTNSNIYSRKSKEFICLTKQNIEFINYILYFLESWTPSSKNLMRSFLIHKCRLSLDNTTKIEEDSISEIYETLEEVLQDILNKIGIVFEDDSK